MHAVLPLRNLCGDEIDLLHAVTDADGVDKERHEDRQRVERIADGTQHAELPHHRDERRADGQCRQGERADVEIDRKPRQHEGNAEEIGGDDGALGDIADEFRKADDHHIGLVVGEGRADFLFEDVRDFQRQVRCA